MLERERRIVLLFHEGQNTLRFIDENATPEQIFNLAQIINEFQAPPLEEVRRIRTIMFA